ncbi:MAG TPA: hypothetical protein VJ508_07375, partial [Saprospiraceae bacterium]|nr:hypothetical protein [Saprospiraceae bacterium]
MGFLLLGNGALNAQATAAGGNNPHVDIAQHFGVVAYPLGNFDRDVVIAALESIASDIKPILDSHATSYQKLEYAYVSNLLLDVQGGYVAVEVSLLKRLEELKNNTKLLGGQNNLPNGTFSPQYANLYNDVVSHF